MATPPVDRTGRVSSVPFLGREGGGGLFPCGLPTPYILTLFVTVSRLRHSQVESVLTYGGLRKRPPEELRF